MGKWIWSKMRLQSTQHMAYCDFIHQSDTFHSKIHIYRVEWNGTKEFYLKMSKCISVIVASFVFKLHTCKNRLNHSPSLADFSAELNCESYFNAASYGRFPMSRCRPCTNWKMPQIPTRKKSTFLTFADLTIADDLQSISIMLEIRWFWFDTFEDYNLTSIGSISYKRYPILLCWRWKTRIENERLWWWQQQKSIVFQWLQTEKGKRKETNVQHNSPIEGKRLMVKQCRCSSTKCIHVVQQYN